MGTGGYFLGGKVAGA